MLTCLEICRKLLIFIVQKSLPYRSVGDQRNDCWLKIIKSVQLKRGRASSVKVRQCSAPHPTHWGLWSSSKVAAKPLVHQKPLLWGRTRADKRPWSRFAPLIGSTASDIIGAGIVFGSKILLLFFVLSCLLFFLLSRTSLPRTSLPAASHLFPALSTPSWNFLS